MKLLVIEEMSDNRGFHAWIQVGEGKSITRLTDVCSGPTREAAAGKLLLGYPEITRLTVQTNYRSTSGPMFD